MGEGSSRQTGASRFKDLTGVRFGKLLVIERVAPGWRKTGQALWRCACDCGGEALVQGYNLRAGVTTSCGCARTAAGQKRRTHGEGGYGKRTKEYRAWQSMIDRCENPQSTPYADYGGRGITVYDDWHDFEVFLAAVGRAPSPSHSLDRIDNMRGYEPGNVRWTTRDVQMNNRRSNVLLSWQGRTMPLTAWASELGMSRTTLTMRLRYGWPVERALTTPVFYRGQQGFLVREIEMEEEATYAPVSG